MLAYIHIEKCAGQSIHWMLRSAYGLKHCDVIPWQGYNAMNALDGFTAQDFRRLTHFYPRLRSIAGHKVRAYADLDEVCPAIQYFTLLREPLKRQASHFQFIKTRRRLDVDFVEWVNNNDWGANWQTRALAGTDDVNEAIQFIQEKKILVGLVERFDESLLLVQRLLDNNLNISYERKNIASDNTIANQLLQSPRTRQILIEQNQADLALYEYVKRELFPAYRQAYGPQLAEDLANFQQARGRFNRLNVYAARVYRNLVYKPAIHLYRRRYGITEKVM